jgi:hypothetical protein
MAKRTTHRRAPPRDRSDKQLTAILPSYVVAQVRGEASRDATTLRVVLLRALARAGFDVDAEDCVDRRAEATRARAQLYRDLIAKHGKPS